MVSRKICIVGDFAVGKTSLVRRFVRQQFSDKYLTTIGVKVDTKELVLPDLPPLKLAIWDIAGTDTPSDLFVRYARGAAGFLLVADATRAETLHCCGDLREAIFASVGRLPHVVLVNKSDLVDECELDASMARTTLYGAVDWLDTSALTGDNVERAFEILGKAVLSPGTPKPPAADP
ncbi:MAG: GTP-binding protein [Thiohalocapsa sp.]|nr:GTP-binding protein [Thiohalocapsa sp.]